MFEHLKKIFNKEKLEEELIKKQEEINIDLISPSESIIEEKPVEVKYSEPTKLQ